MIKTLTTNVVKGKYLRNGKPSGKEYTFYVSDDVLVGDVLELNLYRRNSDVMITKINVDPAEIEPYKNVAKTLTPKPREIKFEEDADNE